MTDHIAPTLRRIGDLDSPLWGDERSRAVWLEGCAVAYQVETFGAALVAAALAWLGSPDQRPWSIAVIVVPALANVAVLRYVTAHGVETPALGRSFRSQRGWLFLVIVLAWAAGLVRARLGVEGSPGFAWGLVAGLATGVIAAFVIDRRRRRAIALPADDVFEDAAD